MALADTYAWLDKVAAIEPQAAETVGQADSFDPHDNTTASDLPYLYADLAADPDTSADPCARTGG